MPQENVLERLGRWARELPNEDEIPITDDEAFEVALAAVDSMRIPSDRRIEETLRAVKSGNFRWLGHRLIIL